MANAKVVTGVHTTDEAHARLRKRYRSEAIFKSLGIIAVLLAVTALATLLWSVLSKAAGALTETYIVAEVDFDANQIDPKLTKDPDVIRKADYGLIVKNTLKSEFPQVKGRKDKRQLYGIVSDGAALELRAAARDNPQIVGQKRLMRLLASDDIDLWYKGTYGSMRKLPSVGTATPTGTEGDIKVVVESNAFQPILQEVKQSLFVQARGFERDAAAQQRGIDLYERKLKSAGDDEELRKKFEKALKRYQLAKEALLKKRDQFIERANAAGGTEQLEKVLPSFLVYINGGVVKVSKVSVDTIEGPVLLPMTSDAPAAADQWQLNKVSTGEAARNLSDKQLVWLKSLEDQGRIERNINWRFFSATDSREAEMAGIWSAAVGSFWTMLVTFCLAFPIGVLAAIFLEEFAPKNRITHFIEVNINNLAAVPSIVFGLLGLAVFINFFGLPWSAPLVGGMVLALMTLPTIIIAARAAIKAVPPSIREAALGVGASNVQATFHHTLPLAMPGIMTGTIIGMAQALGETAPLIMIGMVAFIVDVPQGVTDPASALPVQIYLWSDFPEPAFEMKTAAAIVVLLFFLVIMNALAILLRKRFERRW